MSVARVICAAIVLAVASSPLMPSHALAAEAAPPAAKGPAAKAPAAKVPVAKAPVAKAPAAESAPQLPKLTAAQILEKHIAARGGAQAWKAVQSMQLSGKLDAGHGDNVARAMRMVNAGKKASGKGTSAQIAAASETKESEKEIQLPFTLVLKRPNLTRMEVLFDGKTAVQVFDGEHGWKLRPFLNRSDAEPFTADEMKTESERGDLDGPLIDYAAKGTKVELDGTEMVEGQPAYRLKVTPRKGAVKQVWIDGKTFLDVKMEGFPRRMDGKMHPVYVYQRDFRSVQGVMIPFVMETAVEGYAETHKLQIEKATINPKLDDALFSKPHA
jgi:outer membrane lipoprotein-sorting protein